MSSSLTYRNGDGRPETTGAGTTRGWRRGLRRAAVAIVAASAVLIGMSGGSAGAADQWAWVNLSSPPGVSISSSVGAVGVKDSPTAATRPYVFVRGGDSHLWTDWWNGSAWTWSDQGTPPNVTVASGVGVVTVMDTPTSGQRPYAFVLGHDGHMWADRWTGSAWTWSDQIHPPGVAISSAVGVITVKDTPSSAQRPYVFVLGSDGHLWANWQNGSAWVWSDQGAPPTAAISSGVGVTTVMDSPSSVQRPYIYVRGSDGHLWADWWNNTTWTWSDQGTPPNLTVAYGVGATTVTEAPSSVQRSYAYVRGSDGHLWLNWWNGTAWVWSDESTLPGGLVDSGIGVTTVMDSPSSGQRPYAFVRGTDGHLWADWWSGVEWAWSDRGLPTGTSIGSGAGVMTVMDSATSPQRPYVFVLGADGNLWNDYLQ